MNKRTVIANLRTLRKWVERQRGRPVNEEASYEAQNILVGCAQLLLSSGGVSINGWVTRKAYRTGTVRRIMRTYVTKQGNRALLDLIDLTISSLEVCTWRNDFLPGPLPITREPRRISETQQSAMQKANKLAREARRHEKLQRDQQKVLRALAEFPDGETKYTLRTAAVLPADRLDAALEDLLRTGKVAYCEVVKGNHQTPYRGYRLAT